MCRDKMTSISTQNPGAYAAVLQQRAKHVHMTVSSRDVSKALTTPLLKIQHTSSARQL